MHIYSLVEFDVCKGADVQSVNKAKKSGFSLAGLELNEVGLGSCTSPDKLRGNRHHYFDLLVVFAAVVHAFRLVGKRMYRACPQQQLLVWRSKLKASPSQRSAVFQETS